MTSVIDQSGMDFPVATAYDLVFESPLTPTDQCLRLHPQDCSSASFLVGVNQNDTDQDQILIE